MVQPPQRLSPGAAPPRPGALRANRVVNAGAGLFGFLMIVLLAYGIFLVAAQSSVVGSIVIALAAVLLIGVGRRLGPGRLLVLRVTPTAITLTTSLQPETVIDRTSGIQALLWVHPRYPGAPPTARGLFLLDDGAVRSTSRPLTFSVERLRRFLAATGIRVEVVDAPAASLALAVNALRAS